VSQLNREKIATRISFMPRRGNRTEPGVLTPGTEKIEEPALKGRQDRCSTRVRFSKTRLHEKPSAPSGRIVVWVRSWG
jgi:hypothetical protein